jgi:hypothetical protein
VRLIAPFLMLVAGYGQDPLRTLPQNYHRAFENDLVRVIRVHYGAHEKLVVHDHPKTPTIYVYLSDGGPVRFKHAEAAPFVLERRAVKKGGFRLSAGRLEKHEVESISDTPNDFLRVELKAVPLGTSSLSGRFAPPTDYGRSMTKVEFENANVKIVRFVCLPQGDCETSSPSNPALEVLFSDPEAGEVRWVPEGSQATNQKAMHLLRIEFKKRT